MQCSSNIPQLMIAIVYAECKTWSHMQNSSESHSQECRIYVISEDMHSYLSVYQIRLRMTLNLQPNPISTTTYHRRHIRKSSNAKHTLAKQQNYKFHKMWMCLSSMCTRQNITTYVCAKPLRSHIGLYLCAYMFVALRGMGLVKVDRMKG